MLGLTGYLVRRKRVYVDAKIVGMENSKNRTVYVGYKVEGTNLKGARRVEPSAEEILETDDAEIHAILFAIEEMKENKIQKFDVICDHQSVVSEALRKDKEPKNKLLIHLRKIRDDNPMIGLRALQFNQAHKVVTDFANEQKAGESKVIQPSPV